MPRSFTSGTSNANSNSSEARSALRDRAKRWMTQHNHANPLASGSKTSTQVLDQQNSNNSHQNSNNSQQNSNNNNPSIQMRWKQHQEQKKLATHVDPRPTTSLTNQYQPHRLRKRSETPLVLQKQNDVEEALVENSMSGWDEIGAADTHSHQNIPSVSNNARRPDSLPLSGARSQDDDFHSKQQRALTPIQLTKTMSTAASSVVSSGSDVYSNAGGITARFLKAGPKAKPKTGPTQEPEKETLVRPVPQRPTVQPEPEPQQIGIKITTGLARAKNVNPEGGGRVSAMAKKFAARNNIIKPHPIVQVARLHETHSAPKQLSISPFKQKNEPTSLEPINRPNPPTRPKIEPIAWPGTVTATPTKQASTRLMAMDKDVDDWMASQAKSQEEEDLEEPKSTKKSHMVTAAIKSRTRHLAVVARGVSHKNNKADEKPGEKQPTNVRAHPLQHDLKSNMIKMTIDTKTPEETLKEEPVKQVDNDPGLPSRRAMHTTSNGRSKSPSYGPQKRVLQRRPSSPSQTKSQNSNTPGSLSIENILSSQLEQDPWDSYDRNESASNNFLGSGPLKIQQLELRECNVSPVGSSISALATPRGKYMKNSPSLARHDDEDLPGGIDLSGSQERFLSSGKKLANIRKSPASGSPYSVRRGASPREDAPRLSEDLLKQQEERHPAPRLVNGMTVQGFAGFMNKTKDLPNLADDCSAASSEMLITTPAKDHKARQRLEFTTLGFEEEDENYGSEIGDFGSDVFDGVSSTGGDPTLSQGTSSRSPPQQSIDEDVPPDKAWFSFGPPVKSVPWTPTSTKGSNILGPSALTRTAQLFDTHAATARTSVGSEIISESSPKVTPYYLPPRPVDLSKYVIAADVARKLVRTYRQMCDNARLYCRDEEEARQEDDYKKAFALCEMRSRIMETDIERGISRQGGTTVVDDCVLTSYHMAALRVRDAAIVSKAWRDGASPADVVTAHLLTRRSTHCHYVKRPLYSSDGEEFMKWHRDENISFYWQEVRWMDDADLTQVRCATEHDTVLRGFSIFTLGDSQSLLLKLTNERCLEIEEDLEFAREQQRDAEDEMNEEQSHQQGFVSDGLMTEAEMRYLEAMEDVKLLTHQLSLADRAFNLVRDRITNMISKYETLLVRINEEEESLQDDDFDNDFAKESIESVRNKDSNKKEESERMELARRAQEAEAKAAKAALEAKKAKQEAERMKSEKEAQLLALQSRLAELEKQSVIERERSQNLILNYQRQVEHLERQSAIGTSNRSSLAHNPLDDARSILEQHNPSPQERQKIQSIKERFRNRSRSERPNSPNSSVRLFAESGRVATRSSPTSSAALNQEEMFQHLDFYERSLKAVVKTGR